MLQLGTAGLELASRHIGYFADPLMALAAPAAKRGALTVRPHAFQTLMRYPSIRQYVESQLYHYLSLVDCKTLCLQIPIKRW